MNNKTKVAVIGGGIAAFAAECALRTAGFPVLALKGTEPPTAPERLLVCPRLQRGEGTHARFLRDAYRESCAFYERPPHNKAVVNKTGIKTDVVRGALRLAQSTQEQKRMRALAQELPNLCRWLNASEAQQKSGLKQNATRWGGNFLPHALVLQPRRLLEQDETTLALNVVRTRQEADGAWRLWAENNKAEQEVFKQEVFKAEAIVLALGAHLPAFLQQRVFSPLPPLQHLLAALQTGRGRIDICDKAALARPPRLPVCASGWIMPFEGDRIGIVRGLAPSRAHEARQENRKRLQEWCGLSEDRAMFEKPYEAARLSTRDRLPLLGEIPCKEGHKPSRLFLFSALGGHGFLTAPLCAQKLVRLLQRQDASSAQADTDFLSPQRFLSPPRSPPT